MKNVICTLFGHRPDKGYCKTDGEGYFDVMNIVVDGVGRKHAQLYTECARCKARYKVGMIHLPEKP